MNIEDMTYEEIVRKFDKFDVKKENGEKFKREEIEGERDFSTGYENRSKEEEGDKIPMTYREPHPPKSPKTEEEVKEEVDNIRDEIKGDSEDASNSYQLAKDCMEQIHPNLMTKEQIMEKSHKEVLGLIKRFYMILNGKVNPLEVRSRIECREISKSRNLGLNVMEMDINEVRKILTEHYNNEYKELKKIENDIARQGQTEGFEKFKRKYQDKSLEELRKIISDEELELEKLNRNHESIKNKGLSSKEIFVRTQNKYKERERLHYEDISVFQNELREINDKINKHKDRDNKTVRFEDEEYLKLIEKREQLGTKISDMKSKFKNSSVRKEFRFQEERVKEIQLEFSKSKDKLDKKSNHIKNLKSVEKDKSLKHNLKKRLDTKLNELKKQRKMWSFFSNFEKTVEKFKVQIDDGKVPNEELIKKTENLEKMMEKNINESIKYWQDKRKQSVQKGKQAIVGSFSQIVEFRRSVMNDSKQSMESMTFK